MSETDWPYDADLGTLATLPIKDDISGEGCVFSGLRHDGMCGGPAVVKATVGCVHEHVYADVPVCQYHVGEVAAGDSYCRTCFDHDGHDCPLLADPRGVRWPCTTLRLLATWHRHDLPGWREEWTA